MNRVKIICLIIFLLPLGIFIACEEGEESSKGSIDGSELAGELNCTDGIDNDNDTEIDCDDIDCSFDFECSDVEPQGDNDDDDNDNTPPEVMPEDDTPTTPILLEPINNQGIEQNNPDIGCPFLENFGFGSQIFFDWTDSESPNGIAGYEIFVIGGNAVFPIVDTFVTESEFTRTSCNSFVIDSNLENWTWNVTAVDNEGNMSEVSETGVFRFEECRLEGDVPCNAQP